MSGAARAAATRHLRCRGVDLTRDRHSGMVGKVDCEFLPVEPKWVGHVMNWALWYYDGTEFPVLQLVYPDLENRFPQDEGFDRRFEQPLMQPNRPMASAEKDFWASNDPDSSLFNWKFPDGPHSAVFVSAMVNEGLPLNRPLSWWTSLSMA